MKNLLAPGLMGLLLMGCAHQSPIETNEQRLLADSQRCNQASMTPASVQLHTAPAALPGASPGRRSNNAYFMCMRELGW